MGQLQQAVTQEEELQEPRNGRERRKRQPELGDERQRNGVGVKNRKPSTERVRRSQNKRQGQQ